MTAEHFLVLLPKKMKKKPDIKNFCQKKRSYGNMEARSIVPLKLFKIIPKHQKSHSTFNKWFLNITFTKIIQPPFFKLPFFHTITITPPKYSDCSCGNFCALAKNNNNNLCIISADLRLLCFVDDFFS